MTTKENNNDLFHYTTLGTLCGILNRYRESRKNQENLQEEELIFWPSSIFSMNDPSEMRYGKEVLDVLLPALEKFFKLPPENRLDIANLDSDKILTDYSQAPFVLSLSENKDDLSMWDMYGDKGKGVALIFDNAIAPSSHFRDANFSALVEVNYTKGVNNYPHLQEIYNSGAIEWRSKANEEDVKKCKEETLGRLFTQLCPYIKNPAYKNERECRIVFTEVQPDTIKFRTKGNNIIPYIEVPIPVKYLNGILIGPCCDFDLTNKSLRFILDCCGLQRIQLLGSQIPYRNL